jgi:hypothetical protein
LNEGRSMQVRSYAMTSFGTKAFGLKAGLAPVSHRELKPF